MKKNRTFVAFLRGINVGRHKKVPMAALQTCLEKIGFRNVRTLLASGNVVFDFPDTELVTLRKKIEAQLEDTFGFTVDVIIRSLMDVRKLAASGPFKNITVTPNTRLYVTFLSDKPAGKLKIPYVSPDKSFRILRTSGTEICSVLTLTPGARTPEAMQILEKEYGKNVTTRNWNTIEKILG